VSIPDIFLFSIGQCKLQKVFYQVLGKYEYGKFQIEKYASNLAIILPFRKSYCGFDSSVIEIASA